MTPHITKDATLYTTQRIHVESLRNTMMYRNMYHIACYISFLSHLPYLNRQQKHLFPSGSPEHCVISTKNLAALRSLPTPAHNHVSSLREEL
jgi:hypothetical protein